MDVLVSKGQSTSEAVRQIGVTETTYFRWRREYGGLKTDRVKRLAGTAGDAQGTERLIPITPPTKKAKTGR